MDQELMKLLIENGGLLLVVFLGYKVLTNHIHDIVSEIKGLRSEFIDLKSVLRDGFASIRSNTGN